MIDTKTFNALLMVISMTLLNKIIAETSQGENEAINNLYSSSLYAALEREETKVWHYSVPMLYEIYQLEVTTGKLVFPQF